MSGGKITRCAVYTRKSTEHNLDLEFNSLHAQREACEAYIKSQLHEGWRLIPDPYDDGGISGGSLDRPDLKRLLADIAAGKVDNVVVYKVDRLTRSLTDFAKLVDLFDRHGVSFVSVTQAFNTTNSMGRLTLNVLLSFAQFEREVIGERVRDKIAASKKKGLFMGGNIPLGFTNQDKKLVIVRAEAERVRWIFNRYLELGSIGLLLEEMNRKQLKTKVLSLSGGKTRGGVAFGKGALAYLLKNCAYVGELCHQGTVYTADHASIIERKTFEAVQAALAAKAIERRTSAKSTEFLHTGLIFDSAGNRMTPSHSRKKGVRYRYYISQAILQSRKSLAGEVFRVPAPDIEAVIERFIRDRAKAVPGDIRSLIEAQIARVTVHADSISVELRGPEATGTTVGPIQTISLPWSKTPYRVAKGVASTPVPPTWMPATDTKAKEGLLTTIGKARRWVDTLMAGGTLAQIAKDEAKSERYIRMLVPMAFLSPKIVRNLIENDAQASNIADLSRNVELIW